MGKITYNVVIIGIIHSMHNIKLHITKSYCKHLIHATAYNTRGYQGISLVTILLPRGSTYCQGVKYLIGGADTDFPALTL